MEQKTCDEPIGGEKPGLSVKYVMTVVLLERVYYRWVFLQMLFSPKINCTPEQGQILCSPPLLLITKVSEEAWSSVHLNIFLCQLLGWCLSSGPWKLPAGECIGPQSQCTLFHGLELKINYIAEVRGKTKANPSASGQVDSPTTRRVNALTTASITGTAITQTQGQGATCFQATLGHSMATPPVSPWWPSDSPFLCCLSS